MEKYPEKMKKLKIENLIEDELEEKITEYNVYIDESGDEWLHRGSKYFILAAVLIEKDKDIRISKCIDTIKENLEIGIKKQLHWNLIKGYPNKLMIMSDIGEMDITIINIVVDTTKINFIKSDKIYNYFSGYLYERISWFVENRNAIANINISSRGNLSKEKLLNFIRSNDKKFKIEHSRFKDVKIYPNSQKKIITTCRLLL